MIWSYLHGCMGYCLTDHPEQPTAAQIVVGDFCFFAGAPHAGLVAQAAASLMAPQTQAWAELIESVWGERVEKITRYAIKKEPNVFEQEKLKAFVASLPSGYILGPFDEDVYNQARAEIWSQDFCSQFADYQDYQARGVGVAVLHEGKLVAGASSYSVYNGGIEIQIDTMPEHRRKGLATACGAALILECLKRGLYPSWDAHDLRSVALAEKLGYHLSHPYTVYEKKQAL